MKKRVFLVTVLLLLCAITFVACKQQSEESVDFGPAYFTGEVLEVYDESFLVKIIDRGTCSFFDEQVHVRDVNAKINYVVGDHIRVQYGGVFLQYDPPQVGAESIVIIDSEGNEMPTKEETVMAGGDLIPSVYVNDTLYTSANHIASCVTLSEKCTYLGEVTECVGAGNVPTENFQANHAPVGTEIYQYYSVIYMLQNGMYCPYTAAETDTLNFFASDESIKLLFYDYHVAEETGDLEQEGTEIVLTEEENRILMDMLKPYGETLTTDVLKCDYLRYYCIDIDDRMTLTIDPELGNYGENGDSYLLMMEHAPGAQIKGTYIDRELVDYLNEKLAEKGQ